MSWSKWMWVLLALGLGVLMASSLNGSAADPDGQVPLLRDIGPGYSPDTPLDGIYGEVLANPEANWTVIVYLDGDNNLGNYMETDLSSLTSAGSSANVKVLVLFDQLGRYNTEAYFLTGGIRQSISLSAISSAWTDEVNMGDPNTLVKFSSYCINNYPSQHYLVILQDHGAAWVGCCWDDTSGDHLTLSELDSAFSAIKGRIGHNIDVVLFNDCLMSNIDVLYRLYPYTDFIVGSETLGWTSNYNNEYAGIINWMKSDPRRTAQQVAVMLVDAIGLVDNAGYVTQTAAAVNMSRVAHLCEDMDELSGHLIDYLELDGRGVIEALGASPFMVGPYSGDSKELIDLANFLENLVDQSIDDATRNCALDIMTEIGMNGGSPVGVVVRERETAQTIFTNGISLYFPFDRSSFSSDYLTGNNFTSDTRWDEFLDAYYAYTPHSDPIRIEGDAQLASQALAYGWSGIGTAQRPYLINGLTIKTNGIDDCIFLANLTKYLVISDCTLSGGQNGPIFDAADGVRIINCKNVAIERFVIEKCRYGIALVQSQSSSVRDNTISSCLSGINLTSSPQNVIMGNIISGSISFEMDLEGSGSNQITGNRLSSSSGLGIRIASSNFNTFISNQLTDCCFQLSGDLSSFTSQVIGPTNAVNGLPVLYYKNVDLGGTTIPLGAGQIILGNVTNARVAGQSVIGTRYPLIVAGCAHITIERNSFSDATVGIFMFGSDNSTIRWNDIIRCSENGLRLQSTNDCLVAGNIFSYCTGEGIYLWQSNDNVLVLNELISNHGSGDVFDPDNAQAYDQTGHNSWNDYIKGNYWSDWTTPDGNSDNIIDVPYSISGEAICRDGKPLAVLPSLDLSAPALELIAPLGGHIFNIGQVQLDWTVSDIGTGVGELWARSDPSSSWSNVTGTTSYLFVGLSEGRHTLQLRASDYAGNEIVVSKQVFVDLSAPVITWVAPINGTYVCSASPIISWTGLDVGTAISGYQVSIDAGAWSVKNDISFIQLSGLTQGLHQLSLNASDLGGHWCIFSMSFIVDSILPAISLDGPIFDQMIESLSVQAYWNGSDIGSGILQFEARMDQQAWVNMGAILQAGFIFTNDGPHTLFLRAIDNAGNINLTSVSIIIETSPPLIAISAPSDGAYISTSSIDLVWVGSDAGAGVDHYEIRVDDGEWIEVGMARSWKITDLAEGEHILSVKAVDRTGKEKIAEEKITIDTLAPILRITSPLNGTILDITSIDITWSCQDQGNDRWSISIRIDAGVWTDLGTVGNVNLMLLEGPHNISLRATDRAGNTDLESIDIIIDISGPIIEFIEPGSKTSIDHDQVDVSWKIFDIGGLGSLQFRVDGGDWATIDVNVTGHQFSLSDGDHNIELKAVDKGGHEAIEALALTVDTTAPTVIGYGPVGPSESLQQTIWFILSEDANTSSVHLWVNGVDVDVRSNGTNWSASVGLQLNKTYLLEVEGTDVVGNVMGEYSWTFSTTAFINVGGKVLDQDGRPVVGATVSIGSVVGTTDPNGSFDLQVLPGPMYLIITAPGLQERGMDINIGEGTQIGTIDMVKQSSIDIALFVLIGVLISIIVIASILLTHRKK